MNIASRDIASIPNVITSAGLVLAAHGSQRLDTTQGITEVAIGRSLDIVDGFVARATGHTSKFGAALDATSDKLGGAAIIIGEWQKDIAPKPALAAIVAQNVVNAAVTMATARKRSGTELSPSKAGKYAMAAQNVGLGAYALAHHMHEAGHVRRGIALRYIGHAATIVGVGYLGTKATYSYVQRLRQA